MYQQWQITIPALTGDEPRSAYIYVPDAAVVDDERRVANRCLYYDNDRRNRPGMYF